MPRPRKRRRIIHELAAGIFIPSGVPLERLKIINILPEELEALRLVELEGLSQVVSAESMGISQSTFQRILDHARRQITLALVEQQALRIMSSGEKDEN